MPPKDALKHPTGMPYSEGYFQAELQIRNPTKKLKQYINDELRRAKIYIAGYTNHKDGYDLKISSNKFASQLARNIKVKFKGELKITRRHFSQDSQTGKNLYRMTVFFRQALAQRGDRFVFRGDEYKVKSLLKNYVYAINMRTGEKRQLKYSDVKIEE